MSLAANAVAAQRIKTCFACFERSFMVASRAVSQRAGCSAALLLVLPRCWAALPSSALHGGADGASKGSGRTRADGVWGCLECLPTAFAAAFAGER